jgi:hypothetical protein
MVYRGSKITMIHSNGPHNKHAKKKVTLPFDLLGYCGHAATPVPKSSHNAVNKIALTIEPNHKQTSVQIKGEHNENAISHTLYNERQLYNYK